jgi:hypothetical protein
MATTTQDFVKRIDLTGEIEVNGSQMNQLIDAATVAEDKGLRIVTTDTALDTPDVPNPDAELEGITPTYWYRYEWVRKPYDNTGRVRIYNWNEQSESDATYLKWEEYEAGQELEERVTTLETDLAELTVGVTAAQTTADNANVAAANAIATAGEAETAAQEALVLAGNTQENVTELAATVETIQEDVATIKGQITGINNRTSRVPIAHFWLRDQKESGVSGAGTQAGIFVQRQLNVRTYACPDGVEGYCVLNNDDTLTLVAGVWEIEAICPVNGAGIGCSHQAKLVVTTEETLILWGTTQYCDTTYGSFPSIIKGTFTLTAATIVEIQHQASATIPNGFGRAASIGPEIYTQVKLTYLGSV